MSASSPAQIVPGAGADGLIALAARTFLGPGRRACVSEADLSAVRDRLRDRGSRADRRPGGRGPDLGLQPEQPDRRAHRSRGDRRARPVASRRRRSSSTRRTSSTAAPAVVPLIAGTPNLVAIRTLSKAFGLAALRVGYAVASPEVARELDRRRDPAPGRHRRPASPRPRCATRGSTSRRPSPSGSGCARAARRRRLGRARVARELRPRPNGRAVADRLEAQGLVVRRLPGCVPDHRAPARGERPDPGRARRGARAGAGPLRSRRSGRPPRPPFASRSTSTDGAAPGSRTGVGFLDHLLTLFAFHGGLDLDLLAGGDLEVDEHHTVEDVLAALGDACRRGARRPRRRHALRLCDGADGRGSRDRRRRPGPPSARRGRARLRAATASAGWR